MKLKLKRKIVESKKLLEHINVEGVTFINTGTVLETNFDVFDVHTYDAMCAFTKIENNTIPVAYINNADTFNEHIRGNTHLYIFASEDTNRSVGACITTGVTRQHITLNGSHSYLDANVAFEDNVGHSNNITIAIPLHLIPGSTFVFHREAGDNDSTLETLATMGGVQVPPLTEPEAPIPEEEIPETEPTLNNETTAPEPEGDEESEEEVTTTNTPVENNNTVEPKTPAKEIKKASFTDYFKYKIVGKEVYITYINFKRFFNDSLVDDSPVKREVIINIPETINGLPVTKLWKYCLNIPLTIKYRGESCDIMHVIKGITIQGNSLKEIKNYAICSLENLNLKIKLETPHAITYSYSIYRG